MQVIGAPTVRLATLADEHKHTPADDAGWQESIALVWYDPKLGVGGVTRIGQEPNFEGGQVQSWNIFYTLQGTYFKRQEILALQPGDRPEDGFGVGDIIRYRNDGSGHWQVNETHASATLDFADLHPMLENIPVKADQEHAFFSGQAGHFMTSGRVSGKVTIGDQHYNVSGYGVRNHSWGVRRWGGVRAHRWIAGSVGDHLSFCGYGYHSSEGQSGAMGHVVRDGVMIFAKATDIVLYTEMDGYGHRGAQMRMTLPDGEILEFDIIPICKGVTGDFHDTLFAMQTPCVARLNGKDGICWLETSANPNDGHKPPVGVVNGITASGLLNVPEPGNIPRMKPLR